MPYLMPADIQDLLDLARRGGFCCNGVRDYCRTCDEFYWLHAPDCAGWQESEHHGHRLTIIPFVENRGI